MADQTVTLRLTANAEGLITAVKVAKRELPGIGDQGETAGKRAAAGLNATEKAASSVAEQIKSAKQQLLGFVAGFVGVQGLRQLAGLADQAANIRAQLQLATSSTTEFARAQDEVFNIAQRTSTAMTSTAELYARITRSTAEYGIEQARVLRITETINQTFAVSGTAAVAQANAITQLTQAFAGGVLRAEEFNSVIENSPRLAQALADGLGVGIGELRRMVNEGQVDVAKMISALESQAERVKAEFAGMPLTIERAWTQIANAVLKYVSEADAASGTSARVAKAMSWVAENIESILDATFALGKAFAAVWATRLLMNVAAYTAQLLIQAKQYVINIALARQLGIAQSSGFLASLKSIGLVNAALGTLGAAVAGWQIGTYLREEFVEVEVFGIAMVGGLLAAWERMKQGASIAWEATKAVAIGAINGIREALAGFLSGYAEAAERVDLLGLGEGAIAKVRELSAALKPTTSAAEGFAAAVNRINAETEAAIAAQDEIIEDMVATAFATRAAAAAEKELGEAVAKRSRTQLNGGNVSAELARAQRDHARTLIQQAAALGEVSEHMATYRLALMDAEERLKQQIKLGLDAAAAQLEYARAVRIAQRAAQDAAVNGTMALVDAYEAENAVLRNLSAGYSENIRLAGMSEQQRRVEIASLAAIAEFREANEGWIDAETEALIRQMVASGEAQIAMADSARSAAEESNRAWSTFWTDLGRATLDGSRGVKRYFKQLLDDLKAQIISSGLLRLFSSIFNVGGSGSGASSLLGAMFGGSGGSSGAFSFGSIVSAFGGGSGGTGNSLLSNLFSAQSWARAGQQLAGGFTQMFGGAGNVSALQSYGVLNTPTGMAGGFAGHGGMAGWGGAAAGALYGYGRGDGGVGTAASTLAGGVAGYYAGGTIAAAATGGLAAGGAAMAAIPVVGWIAAAALAIDALTGGKLFGTRYRPESSESTLSLGESGGDASMSIREVRQRSLFRGRRWRTRDVEAGDEAEAAADQLYEAIYGVMADSARALSIDTPPMIDAAIRTVVEYDKKGKAKATKIFVDVLGRTWEEASAELAASRLSSEALIATIDAALGTTVEAVIGEIGEGIDGAAPRIRERFDEMITGILPKDEETGTQTVGEASAIAERWRHDAELLAAGAQFLLVAATDIRRGVGLLGEEGGLTEITDLIEELQGAGESLAQTYGRVAASAALFEQMLGISGQQLDQSREAFVRWSTGIVDAAGGLDRASSLVATYVDRYFSAAERAQYALAQANVSGQREFDDIGLDLANFTDEGGMARLRALFEADMANMSEAMVAEWLEALAVLAAVTDAQAAYNQVLAEGEAEAAAAAAELADFMSTVRESGTDAARTLREWDLSPMQRQLGEVARQTQSNIVAARRMGATEAELAEIRQIGADQAQVITRQAADDLNELLGTLRFDDALAGMSEAEAQLARLNAQYDGYIAQAIALGASEEQLAEIREIQERAIGRLGDTSRNAANGVNSLAEAINGMDQLAAGFDGLRSVTDMLNEARASVLGDGLSESQRAIRDINQRFDDLVGSATAQLQAARIADSLGIGDYRLTEQIESAIAELEVLRVTAITQVHERAAERERELVDQRYRREVSWIERLNSFRDSLALDEQLSTLTPEQRMTEAERQYRAAISAIEAARLTEGTEDDDAARGAYESVARQLLTEGRSFLGDEPYERLRARVLGDIDRFIGESTVAIGQQVIASSQIVIPDGAVQLDIEPVTAVLSGIRSDSDEQTVALLEEHRATRRELEHVREALREIAANTRQQGGKVRAI